MGCNTRPFECSLQIGTWNDQQSHISIHLVSKREEIIDVLPRDHYGRHDNSPWRQIFMKRA